MLLILWVALAVAAIVLELTVSTAFFALFIAVAFAAGAAAALLGAPVFVQCLVIAAVAPAGIAVARPRLGHHWALAGIDPVIPGVSRLVWQNAITVDEVGDEHHPGHALLAGERWLAISEGDAPLPPQMPVTVVAVRGTTLVVRPVDRLGGASV